MSFCYSVISVISIQFNAELMVHSYSNHALGLGKICAHSQFKTAYLIVANWYSKCVLQLHLIPLVLRQN